MMEEYVGNGVEKWIQSQVVEVEVSSEERPNIGNIDSFQFSKSRAGLSKKHSSNELVQYDNSDAENVNFVILGNYYDQVKTSSLKSSVKRQRKHFVSEVETDYEFDDESGKFKCNRCQKYFSQKSYIIYHLRNICGVEPKFVCPFCSFKTKSQLTLKIHVQKFHDDIPAQSDSLRKPGEKVGGANSNALMLKSEQEYLQNFEVDLSEHDSSSCSGDGSQSDLEEETQLLKGAQEPEPNVIYMEADEDEQLKRITASLEKTSNPDKKELVKCSSNNITEPKKVIRFVNIDCAPSSTLINPSSKKKMSNIALARRHQQNLQMQQEISNVDVQFIKMETPESDRLMQSIPIRRRRIPKSESIPAKTMKEPKSSRRKAADLPNVDEDYEFDEEVGKFKCKRCGKLLKNRVAILNHLRNICNVEPKHVCPFCSYRTKYAVCLKVHIAKIHCGLSPMGRSYGEMKSSKRKAKSQKIVKNNDKGQPCDSNTSLSDNASLSCSEDSYGSEFKDESNKEPKKVEVWKENEFVYDVRQDIFRCKSCNQVFKTKGVVALHRHVACSSTSCGTVQ